MVSRHESGRVSTSSLPRSGVDSGAVSRSPELSHHGTVDTMVLSDTQQEILAMLEDRPSHIDARVAEREARGFSADVALAVFGAMSVFAGIVLLFFFAAMGSILLVTGAILCAVAFEHVALADLSSDELEIEPQAPSAARNKAVS